MNPLPIRYRFRPTNAVQRDTVAWFLPGADVERWLRVLTPFAQERVRLHVLADDRGTTQGVLVTGLDGVERPCRDAQPYGIADDVLYLPTDTRLEPPFLEGELRAASAFERLVFHPCCGVCGFERSDVLTLADLVAPIEPERIAFRIPDPGVARTPHLLELLPVPGLPVLDFEEEKRTIGDQGLGDLAPKSSRPRSRPGLWKRSIARVTYGLARRIPEGTARQPTWIDRLEEWAERVLAWTPRQRNDRLDVAMRRLLALLRDDPEEGLHYAIPLDGSHAHRGVAPGDAELRRRTPRVDLDVLRGGRPIAPWNVGSKTYDALRERYHELATRELEHGRPARAAFIYLNLLKDLDAAANVLEQAGMFREAARIHESYRTRPLDAARCLERAGDYEAALASYEAEEAWMQAARLLLSLGRTEGVKRVFRRAVDVHVQRGEFVEAARLIERGLGLHREAHALLVARFVDRPADEGVLEEAFALLERHGEVDLTLALIERLERLEGVEYAWPVTRRLSEVAAHHADSGIRDRAERVALHACSLGIREARGPVDGWVRLVSAMHPEDLVLQRDATRFARGTSAVTSRARRRLGVREVGGFRLDVDHLLAVDVKGDHFGAFCLAGSKSPFVIGNATGVVDSFSFGYGSPHGSVFLDGGNVESRWFLCYAEGLSRPEGEGGRAASFGTSGAFVGWPAGDLPEGALCVARDPGTQSIACCSVPDASRPGTLKWWNEEGTFLSSHVLAWPAGMEPDHASTSSGLGSASMVASEDGLFLLFGKAILHLPHPARRPVEAVKLDGHSMASARLLRARGSLPPFAVIEDGERAVKLTKDSLHQTIYLAQPGTHVGLLQNGCWVTIGRGKGRLLSPLGEERHTFAIEREDVVEILPLGRAHFGVFGTRGHVHVFEVT